MTAPSLLSHALATTMTPLSELVFGAAALGGRVPASDGLRALDAALEAGVTGIDLARSYGYGEAEGHVGRALLGRRERVVLCTKAGIAPARPSPAVALAQTLAQRAAPLLDAMSGLRQRLTSLARQMIPAAPEIPLDPASIMTSFETSLRELRTDRIDILLAHRCPPTIAAYDALAEAFERARSAGRLHLWGISGTVHELKNVTAHAPPPVVQIVADVTRPPIPEGLAKSLVMIAQPFGGGAVLDRLVTLAPRAATFPEREQWAVEVALRGLVTGRTTPTVVVTAMNRPRHVTANVAALATPKLATAEVMAIVARLQGVSP